MFEDGSNGTIDIAKDFIEGELDGRSGNCESVVRRVGGVEPFAVVHAGRESGSREK